MTSGEALERYKDWLAQPLYDGAGTSTAMIGP